MKRKLLLLGCFYVGASLLANASVDPIKGVDEYAKCSLNGNVLHGQTGKPLRNVSITAYLSSRKEKVIVTNYLGNYSFINLKPGCYKLVFEKDGFKKIIKEKVYLRPANGSEINVEMPETEDFDFLPGALNFLLLK